MSSHLCHAGTEEGLQPDGEEPQTVSRRRRLQNQLPWCAILSCICLHPNVSHSQKPTEIDQHASFMYVHLCRCHQATSGAQAKTAERGCCCGGHPCFGKHWRQLFRYYHALPDPSGTTHSLLRCSCITHHMLILLARTSLCPCCKHDDTGMSTSVCFPNKALILAIGQPSVLQSVTFEFKSLSSLLLLEG